MRGTAHGQRPLQRAVLRALAGVLAPAALWATAGCTTVFDNRPINQPLGDRRVEATPAADTAIGENVVALSLSGGGLRAAAFSLGVLQAVAGPPEPGAQDRWNDIAFISSVSGGSLTAAFVALRGREALQTMRDEVLLRDLESDLRMSLWSPANWARLVAGGLNDRSNLGALLDREVFGGATFAQLLARGRPEVWINATDLYNRTPFPFTRDAFQTLCSELDSLRVSEAVAASMAVPLVFAPVVLKTYPDRCHEPLPTALAAIPDDPARVTSDPVSAAARAMRNYRDPQRMRYVKLSDGGLTDNQGLASVLISRAVAGTPYAPLDEADALRVRRMLFLIVDAGRPPTGDWALRVEGPSGVDVGVAAADAAIDSATRLSVDAFRQMVQEWERSVIGYRCSLPPQRRPRWTVNGAAWHCDDVRFTVATVSSESLDPQRARRLREMPTRLSLPADDIDVAIEAGRSATASHPLWQRYLQERQVPRQWPIEP